MTERLCINCKHFTGDTGYGWGSTEAPMACRALKGIEHPVWGGDLTTIPADLMRMTLCGWSDPKLWEPKK